MIKAIEESLTQRYKVAIKYIESVNKLPEKKKKQQRWVILINFRKHILCYFT